MLSRNKIKYITSLRHAKYRNLHNEFIVEGTKVVLELLKSSWVVKEIFALDKWLHDHLGFIDEQSTSTIRVSEKELERISALNTPSEVIAICEIPERIPDKLVISGLVVVLDDIRDPGNLGTIIRTADWFGIKNIICSPQCVDLYNPKVVQATMGSLTRVNVYYADLGNFLKNLPSDLMVYGAALEGQSIHEVSLSAEGVIIIGNESTGLSGNVLPFITKKLYIPAYDIYNGGPKAESLNAAIACSIILYEFRKHMNL
ncbi:MAG: RNA methyltransferase [Bacteroidetes bacterium]|nr:RNA methyltransferase [Bacteroidota bacterium]